jgi:sugar phosphate isomerase/epimerase
VSDGPADRSPDHAWATRRHRMVPGEGQSRVAATVTALRHAGCRSPLTVEVYNDELAETLGPVPFAQRLGEALQATYPTDTTED